MRLSGLIGVVLGAGGLFSLVTASCVGSDSVGQTPGLGTDASTEGGGSSGTSGPGPNGCNGPEKCGNKIDDNCNGQIDEGCDCSGTPEGVTRPCGQDGPGICTKGIQTCKEHEWSECTGIAALAKEIACDGKDENCDGQVDEGLKITCVKDADHDGFGSTAAADKKEFCPVTTDTDAGADAGDGGDAGDDAGDAGDPNRCPADYILASKSLGDDCNDGDEKVKPGVTEHCDAIDSDCDGKPRNGCPSSAETFASPTQTGTFGISTQTAGCGTQVYGSQTTTCSLSAANGLNGFAGYPNAQFKGPTQISLSCNDGVINETPGALYSYSYITNGGNTAAPLAGVARGDQSAGGATCDNGQWLVGLKWTAGCLWDRVTIICAPITFEGQDSTWVAKTGAVSTKVALGNPGSLLGESTYQCPSGSIITSITEFHTTGGAADSNYISGWKISCSKLGFTPQ